MIVPAAAPTAHMYCSGRLTSVREMRSTARKVLVVLHPYSEEQSKHRHATPDTVLRLRAHYLKDRRRLELLAKRQAAAVMPCVRECRAPPHVFIKEPVDFVRDETASGCMVLLRGRALHFELSAPPLRWAQRKLALAFVIYGAGKVAEPGSIFSRVLHSVLRLSDSSNATGCDRAGGPLSSRTARSGLLSVLSECGDPFDEPRWKGDLAACR